MGLAKQIIDQTVTVPYAPSAGNYSTATVNVPGEWVWILSSLGGGNGQKISFDGGPWLPITGRQLFKGSFNSLVLANPNTGLTRSATIHYLIGRGDPPDFPSRDNVATRIGSFNTAVVPVQPAVQLVASSETIKKVTLTVTGSTTAYIGSTTSVTDTNGFQMTAGVPLIIESQGDIWAYCTGGANAVFTALIEYYY